MMNRKLPLILTVACLGGVLSAKAQLYIDNATFHIQSGATVTVQGDVISNVDIQGAGKVLLKGSANQNVHMNGFTIPNLEMDNAANATLLSNARIGTTMLFTNGKITQGNFNVNIAPTATMSGGGASKFFETNGTGRLVKEVTSNLAAYEMPVGIGGSYYPAFVTTSGTYSSASVSVQGKNGADPNKHIRSTDYLNLNWPVTRTGITGTVDVTGNYNGYFTGTETDMRGIFWNGSNWVLSGSSINYASDNTTSPVPTNGTVYAMNRFVLSRMKVFLQGAFNGTDMNDALRAGTNLIPLSDPYRSAPYNTGFTHVNNAVTEIAAASVFNNAAIVGDNIVDWVFLELRDNSGVNPGATVVQTRAALVQRDGDIVDIDGVSPIYFKNVNAAANYTLAVRHRNHLGISTDPVANLQTLNEANPVSITDYTSMTDAQIFGTSAAYTVTAGSNLLWGGNANFNANVRYNGPTNDRDYILATVLSGNQGTILTNVYSAGDVNMNRGVRYNGPANDRDFILATSLGGAQGTIRTQALPN